MYQPFVLPELSRRKPRRKGSDKEPVAMDLNAIRSRRARLEALTHQRKMKPEPKGGSASSIRSKPPSIRRKNSDVPFSANKMKKKEKEKNNSAGVRLEPMRNAPDVQRNSLDAHKTQDPLLRDNYRAPLLEKTPRPLSRDGAMHATDESEDISRKSSFSSIDSENRTKQLIANLSHTEDDSVQLQAATEIRTRVSDQPYAPIDEFVDAGVVPPLIDLLHLNYDKSPELQVESLWALTNIAAGTTSNTMSVIDADGIPPIKRLLASKNEAVSTQALWAISNIIGDSMETRDRAVEAGVVPSIAQMIYRYQSAEAQRIIAWTFSNLMRYKPNRKMTEQDRSTTFKALEHYLTVDEDTAKVDAVVGFEMACNGDDNEIQEVLDTGVLPTLVDYLEDPDSRLVKASVKAVGNMLSGNDKQTDTVIQEEALPVLVKLLHDDDTDIQKEAAWALSNALAGTPTQVMEVLDCNVLPILVKMLNDPEVTDPVGKEICWCIANICSAGNSDAVDEVVLNNFFPVMMNYYRRNERNHAVMDLKDLIFTASVNMMQKTTKGNHLKNTVKYSEMDLFINAHCSDLVLGKELLRLLRVKMLGEKE